jgi:hypothetical protein
MHELKELIHDCLEELPVRFEEPGILANDIHDVGRNDSLVVLAPLDFTETKKILDDSDQEALLCLFV